MPQRRFGRHAEWVTTLGLGGHHFGGMREAEAVRSLEMALERGVRFIDTAESYQSGGSESRLGETLGDRRDHCFLMTKSTAKDGDRARRHLEGSLTRLKTDYLDLWQIHAIQNPGDVDRRIDQGVLDAFLQAREQGKTRYLGVTGHTDYRAFVHLLGRLDTMGLQLDAAQFPINIIEPHYASFITHVLPMLVERGYAVLAMKTLAAGALVQGEPRRRPGVPPIPGKLSLQQASDFVMSYPVSTRVMGFESADQLSESIGHVVNHQAMSDADRQALLEQTADLNDGKMESYKA